MSKIKIFKQIQKIEYYTDLKPIFSLLEPHLERIEFVKEAIGLKNFLFLAEKGTKEFEGNPLYACFNVSTSPDNEELNYVSMKKSMIISMQDILSKLNLFLSNSDQPLYIWVVFEESSLEQEDMFRVMDELRSTVKKSPFEAKAKLRKYPSWFEGKLPSEIFEESTILSVLTTYDEMVHTQMKDFLLKEIEKAVFSKDKTAFASLCTQYNKVYRTEGE